MSVLSVKKLKQWPLPLLGCGLMLVSTGLAYLLLTPPAFRARAAVRVEKRDWVHTNSIVNPYDPELAPAQCQIAASDPILDQAIADANLNARWARRYNHDTPLKTPETRSLLKSLIHVHPLGESMIIAIEATSEDRMESAAIANAIARAYCGFERAAHEQLVRARTTDLLSREGGEWNSLGGKIKTAEERVYQLYLGAMKYRATNQVQIYDPASYQRLQARRIDLGTEFVRQRDLCRRLGAMSHDELADLLPIIETNNPALTGAQKQLLKARDDLRDAARDHGANSQEFRAAAQAVAGLGKYLDQTVAGTLANHERNLAEAKAALDDLEDKLKNASTNTTALTLADSEYAKARQDLEKLRRQRELLEDDLGSPKTGAADQYLSSIVPVSVVAELVDEATPPLRPAIPNPLAGFVVIWTGVVAVLASLVTRLLCRQPKPSSATNGTAPKP